MDLDRLFTPTFETKQDPARSKRQARERDVAAAITTYRYLRLGMIMVVIALVASLLLRRNEAGCWQGSISAYYYTPVQGIFVSAMLAIGIALIMIKGSTILEDVLLNLAGMAAPIVAFVPTSFEPLCRASSQPVGETGAIPTTAVTQIQNNVGALLIAGSVAVVVGLLVLVIDKVRRTDEVGTGKVISRVGLLVVMGGAVGIGWWLLASEEILTLHGWSAVFMFGALALAAIWNGASLWYANRRDRPRTSRYWWLLAGGYLVVGVLMIGLGAWLNWGVADPWPHRILVLELVEIVLFGLVWVVQSIERWGKVTQAPVPEAAA